MTKNIKTIGVDSKCPHCNGKIKEKAYLKEYVTKSLSFADCNQRTHQKVFDKIKQYALETWKVDFDAWFEEWSMRENTLQ
jgi:hypothetical protein